MYNLGVQKHPKEGNILPDILNSLKLNFKYKALS